MLSFLYFNSLLQSLRFRFQLLLFRLIALAHHVEPLVAEPSCGVVLIGLDEQPLQFCNPLLIALQLLAMDLNLLAALQPHLLAHDGHEVVLMVQDMIRYHLDVVQHQTLQNRLSDVVCAALLLVLPVEGTIEESILRLVVVGGTVIHLCAAVGAIHQTGEHAGSSAAGHAVALLADLLHLFKHIVLNDALMGVREHGLIFQRVSPLFFVPDGIGEGLEIHRAAGVLPAFQNFDHRAVRPFTGIFRQRVSRFLSLLLLVSGRCQHLIRSQLIGNLGRATALHAHGKDPLDHLCGLRVDDPVVRVVRVLHIAIRHIDRQRDAFFALGLLNSTNLTAGITGVKLVEPVLDPGKIVVHAVGIGAVEVVVDGDEPGAVLGEGQGGVEACHSGVSAQAGQILDNAVGHLASLNLGQHLLKTGTVKVGAGISVIHKEHRICHMVLSGIRKQDTLLILNGEGFASSLILLRKSAIESGNFIGCSKHFCFLLWWSNCQYRGGCHHVNITFLVCHASSPISVEKFCAVIRSSFRSIF